MSAIKNGVYTVTLKGKEYGLLFSLNALDEVQGRFGGYDKLGEIFNDKTRIYSKIPVGCLPCLSMNGSYQRTRTPN